MEDNRNSTTNAIDYSFKVVLNVLKCLGLPIALQGVTES